MTWNGNIFKSSSFSAIWPRLFALFIAILFSTWQLIAFCYRKLLSWAWLTCLFFIPEILVKSAANSYQVWSFCVSSSICNSYLKLPQRRKRITIVTKAYQCATVGTCFPMYVNKWGHCLTWYFTLLLFLNFDIMFPSLGTWCFWQVCFPWTYCSHWSCYHHLSHGLSTPDLFSMKIMNFMEIIKFSLILRNPKLFYYNVFYSDQGKRRGGIF